MLITANVFAVSTLVGHFFRFIKAYVTIYHRLFVTFEVADATYEKKEQLWPA